MLLCCGIIHWLDNDLELTGGVRSGICSLFFGLDLKRSRYYCGAQLQQRKIERRQPGVCGEVN